MPMQTHETTISRTSRNIGIGWTTDTRNTPSGAWEMATVEAPRVVGSYKRALGELARVAGMFGNGGTFYSVTLFVGGERVIGANIGAGEQWLMGHHDLHELLEIVGVSATPTTVTVTPATGDEVRDARLAAVAGGAITGGA